MYTSKDKVSRMFAATSPPPAVGDQNPQANSYPKGGNGLYSYFSYIIPSISCDGSTSYEPEPSVPHGYVNLGAKDETLETFEDCRSSVENRETETGRENDGGQASSMSRCGSEVFLEATSQPSSEKEMAYLMEDSVLISSDLYQFLLSSLPNIVKGCQWALLYSTAKHGISLRTLIRKSAEAEASGPCLLIAGDMQGAIFGGLLDAPLNPTAKRKYQGTNQAFVFTTIYGQPRLFRPTGANRYYYMCLNDLLAFGGGGNFAICLDGEFGTSGPCETFGNLCLAYKPDYELKNVELWGFTHASRYRS